MKNCTTAAVLGAISKLTPSISNLRVKRKYKSLSNNKIAWWFIIHGQETELGTLEAQWERVQLQTGWSLQPYYMPKDEQQANVICIPEEPANLTEEPVKLGGSDDQQPRSQLSTSAEIEQGPPTQDAPPLNSSEEPGDARANTPLDPHSPATNNSFFRTKPPSPSWSVSSNNIFCNKVCPFSVLYFNSRSVLPKIDELRALCLIHNPSIVCIVESWLDDSITDNELCIDNYAIVRADRNRHGGGAPIYVLDTFSFNVIYSGSLDLELIILSVCLAPPSPLKLSFGLFYRPRAHLLIFLMI